MEFTSADRYDPINDLRRVRVPVSRHMRSPLLELNRTQLGFAIQQLERLLQKRSARKDWPAYRSQLALCDALHKALEGHGKKTAKHLPVATLRDIGNRPTPGT